MKKLFAVVLVGLSLAGCAALNIKNPINNNTLGGTIATYGLLDSAVIAYRGLPRCTVSHPFTVLSPCYSRSILVQLQSYDAKANKAVNDAVNFTRDNPTLDASSYISAAELAIANLKNFAALNNVPVQGIN